MRDIFRGFGRSTVAKIGRTEITVEQFRNLYNDRLQQYSRQAGRPIGPEQARQLGLDRVLVGQIVSEILLDERARALGLSLSDAEVAKQITTDPAFQGLNGQFDRARFEQVIRNAGFTEARFVAEQRRRPCVERRVSVAARLLRKGTSDNAMPFHHFLRSTFKASFPPR